MTVHFDKDGNPIDAQKWSRLLGDEAYKRVALDEVDGVRVSTAWIGLDHGHGMGRPLIFETMVFGGPLDEECRRYSTLAQAVAGHADMVAAVKRAPRAN